MKRLKLQFIILITVLLFLFLYISRAIIACDDHDKNLIENGSFNESNLNFWEVTSYVRNPNPYKIMQIKKTKNKIVKLESNVADHIRLIQKVNIKTNSSYLFSCKVKTSDVKVIQENGNMGANIYIPEKRKISRSIIGSSKWEYLSIIFNSGNLEMVTLVLQLGHYGSTSAGKVYFDDISLIKLDLENIYI